jgi:hypothetical protein
MSKFIKVSQFGGVGGGGQVSPFAPGRSPIGRGGSNSGGLEINVSWDENQNFDMLLRRTHPDSDNSDRNIETRLTPQHKSYEETKSYLLTPQERLREKFRRELHNYKKSLEEQAENINNNSVEYIQKHFQPKEEHMVTMEENLSKRRKYPDFKKITNDLEDDIPELIKPERIHPVLSDSHLNRIAQIVMRDKLTKEEDSEERNPFDVARFTVAPLGRTPVLTDGYDLETYFQKLREEASPSPDGQREVANTDTVLTNLDPDYQANIHPRKEIANEPADDGVMDIDLFVSLENNLHPKKTPKNYYDRNNMGEGRNKEDMGVEEVYPGSAFFGIHTPASFQ